MRLSGGTHVGYTCTNYLPSRRSDHSLRLFKCEIENDSCTRMKIVRNSSVTARSDFRIAGKTEPLTEIRISERILRIRVYNIPTTDEVLARCVYILLTKWLTHVHMCIRNSVAAQTNERPRRIILICFIATLLPK